MYAQEAEQTPHRLGRSGYAWLTLRPSCGYGGVSAAWVIGFEWPLMWFAMRLSNLQTPMLIMTIYGIALDIEMVGRLVQNRLYVLEQLSQLWVATALSALAKNSSIRGGLASYISACIPSPAGPVGVPSGLLLLSCLQIPAIRHATGLHRGACVRPAAQTLFPARVFLRR